ncbi:2-oxoadipate dioxygenase/decarboxylase [Streptomyces sp. NPDC002156]
MRFVDSTELRAGFAARLSTLYGTEVPAYTTLVDVSHEVNQRVMRRDPEAAQRLGTIERVTAERHGAIRVGSPAELAQVARIFGALGMRPTGFYDLRDARPRPIPVISTAFRPTDRAELARNPFRVFTSMLVPEDGRFFDADLAQRLRTFIGGRRLFGDELLTLADHAEAEGGLKETDAERFLTLATAAFALSPEPVDRAWYGELERVSDVAADIGGVTSTHINHLTPRVLDIDDLYADMSSRGIAMIDRIQGPPHWEGPDVLLRQTSFRALSEPRRFREPDGSVRDGELRVRFGEVEARGIALTPAGRDLYDRLVATVDERSAARPADDRQDVAAEVWREGMPRTERELAERELAFFTYRVREDRPPGPPPATASTADLITGGWVEAEPIVYEDFLPRSAAGIFASNLSGAGHLDTDEGGAERDLAWLSGAVDREIHVPEELYRAESEASLATALTELGASPQPASPA